MYEIVGWQGLFSVGNQQVTCKERIQRPLRRGMEEKENNRKNRELKEGEL